MRHIRSLKLTNYELWKNTYNAIEPHNFDIDTDLAWVMGTDIATLVGIDVWMKVIKAFDLMTDAVRTELMALLLSGNDETNL